MLDGYTHSHLLGGVLMKIDIVSELAANGVVKFISSSKDLM